MSRLLRTVREPDRGSTAIWLVLITPVLFGFAGLVLDGGRVLAARQKAANIAEQAARVGVDTLDITAYRDSAGTVDVVDPSRARSAACSFVAVAEPGSGCSVQTSGNQVTVRVTVTTPTAVLGVIGVNSLTTTGMGAARSAVGITGEGR
ncbi:MAG: pilus assembly protein [Sporichthyaceae bacterium]|nr:pilus assembly protein [Sporichthyaceae bacterium]